MSLWVKSEDVDKSILDNTSASLGWQGCGDTAVHNKSMNQPPRLKTLQERPQFNRL